MTTVHEITVSALLNGAADLIERTGWTKRAFARDANDLLIEPNDQRATCFCLYGALHHVLGLDIYGETPVLAEARDRLREFTMGLPAQWNDQICSSKEEAVKVLRKAAEAASA